MVLVKRSKVRIRGIKGRFEEKKKDFWHFGDPEKKERKTRKERGKKGVPS